MGPFELMDLVGIDVGHAVARSFYEQSHGEPRWRPSPLAARMVAGGRLGRKSGRGWYAYPPGRPPDPPAPEPRRRRRAWSWWRASPRPPRWLLAAAAAAGWDAPTPWEAEGEVPSLIVDCGAAEDDPPLQGGAAARCSATRAPLSAQDPGGASAGFFLPAPVLDGGLVELTRTPTTAPAAAAAAERFFATLGRRGRVGRRRPGARQRPHARRSSSTRPASRSARAPARAADIDAGMVLGLNHPRGPLAWGDEIGPAAVLDTAARAVGGVPRGALPPGAGARARGARRDGSAG